MKNLFTIIIDFSNNEKVIWQYEEKTPLDALIQFVRYNDTLEGYDREELENSLSHLHHSPHERGVWTFTSTGRTIRGGTIIQTDKEAYLRSHR